MTKPLSETTVTLMRAREILEKGWCQHSLQDNDKYCVVGSIRAALGIPSETLYPPKEEAYCAAVGVVQREIGYSVAFWNDAEGRTHAEVLDVMDQAIQRSIEEG